MPETIATSKRRSTRTQAEREQYRKPQPRSATTGRKCRFVTFPGTPQERPCGKSTGTNYFFCKQHHEHVDDYNVGAIQ